MKVLTQQEDGSMVADAEWHARTREKYEALFQFLEDENLLANTSVLSLGVDLVVIRLSDLTDAGQKLFRSGDVGKWLASFDRSPSKAFNDVRLLRKALANNSGR